MLERGVTVPAFELQQTSGSPETEGTVAAAKPALLAFFKVSCPVCQYSFPFLERIAKGGGLRVVGVSQDDAEATLEFSSELGLGFEMLLDQHPYRASRAFGVENVPSLFVIEPNGVVSMSFDGFSKADFETLGRRAGVDPLFMNSERIPGFRPG